MSDINAKIEIMRLELILTGLGVIFIFAYLIYALVFPEKF